MQPVEEKSLARAVMIVSSEERAGASVAVSPMQFGLLCAALAEVESLGWPALKPGWGVPFFGILSPPP